MGEWSGLPLRKIKEVSRSFHTHMNWKVASEASAGTESGMTIVQNVRKDEAPSIWADSIRSLGRDTKKLRSRKTANGKPKAVCAIQTAQYWPVNPMSVKMLSTGPS